MPKAVLSASINLDVAAKVAQEAQQRGWSISELVNKVLQDYFAQQVPSGRVATVHSQDERR